MKNSKENNNQLKYVDLEGLKTFAKELKMRMQYKVIEETIYKDLKNSIDSAVNTINRFPFKRGPGRNSAQQCNTGSIANGDYSHAEGVYTITNNLAEHSEGKYNKSNPNTLHSIGIGLSDELRKNAYEVTNTGRHYIYGIGGYDGTNSSEINNEGILAIDLTQYIIALENKISLLESQFQDLFRNVQEDQEKTLNKILTLKRQLSDVTGYEFAESNDIMENLLMLEQVLGDITTYVFDGTTSIYLRLYKIQEAINEVITEYDKVF